MSKAIFFLAMQLSTTANRLSGDSSLSLRLKLQYFANCTRDNFRSARWTMPVRFAATELPSVIPSTVFWNASPPRFYSDVFWTSLPWQRISSQLGPVRVLELGCGSGSKFGMLDQWLGPALVSYTGVDIRRRASWDQIAQADTRAQFLETAAESLPSELLSCANLIMSQSALEHIQGDLAFFINHYEHGDSQKPVMQIHVVPAEWSLFLYLFHGYRQYSPGAISRIASVYPTAQCTIVPLGGFYSCILHWLTITLPTLLHVRTLRQVKEKTYTNLLRACYARERFLDSRFPLFYAIILQGAGQQLIL